MDQPVYGATWAGYDAVVAAPSGARAARFTGITGDWVAPAADCNAGDPAQSSVWIGLGGALATAAVYGPLQVGTDSDCSRGRPRYFAWYEAYPEPLQVVRLSISPGDSLAATVSLDAAGRPTMTLDDETTHRHFTKLLRDVRVKPLATDSAEWIVEGPPRREPVLTDFGSVTFTDATATQADGAASHTGPVDDPAWGYTEPDVLGFDQSGVHQSAVERSAAPGPLDATGEGFTVSFGAGATGLQAQ
jgi:hypothetical protein